MTMLSMTSLAYIFQEVYLLLYQVEESPTAKLGLYEHHQLIQRVLIVHLPCLRARGCAFSFAENAQPMEGAAG